MKSGGNKAPNKAFVATGDPRPTVTFSGTEMNERIARTAVNLGCGLSVWYVLNLAIWVAWWMSGISGRGGLAGFVAGTTVIGSILALPIIVTALIVLLSGSVQFLEKWIRIALLSGGLVVTGLLVTVFAIVVMMFGF